MSSAREVMRDSPNVIVRFNEPHRIYQPRAALILRYSIEGIDNEKVRADNAEAELNRLRELLSAQRINLDENS